MSIQPLPPVPAGVDLVRLQVESDNYGERSWEYVWVPRKSLPEYVKAIEKAADSKAAQEFEWDTVLTGNTRISTPRPHGSASRPRASRLRSE